MSSLLKTIILADGNFPGHEIPFGYLRNAARIICCDGSADNLVSAGFIPDAIVGDLDSVSDEVTEKYSDRLFPDQEQETNDLTKAVNWCIKRDYRDIVILGATGKREDHTIGNISLLTEYAREADVMMVTDTGIIRPFLNSCSFSTIPRQQISVFSANPEIEISSQGLLYPLDRKKLKNWWEATLNEATGENVELFFERGAVLVFIKF
ncbi:MAG: thiamine diphosphokinase [Bacteroidales bacterium]|nr:thiamine diphosphokinase [Bacteroidales bacterium]